MDHSVFEFNGNTAINTRPLFDNIRDSFTYEFWVKPSQSHLLSFETNIGVSGIFGQRYVIGPGHGKIPSAAGAGVSVGMNGVSVYEHTENYFPAMLVYETPILDWVHVAVVYQDNTPYLYLNGEFKKKGLASEKQVHPSGTIGALDSIGYFAGQLKDLRIWDYPRTEHQIKQEMNKRPRGDEPGLSFLLRKDEDDEQISPMPGSIETAAEKEAMLPEKAKKKKAILVIDRYVPRFNRDAGSRSTFHYIKLFTELGMDVTFLSDSPDQEEPYTSILKQSGIEVIFNQPGHEPLKKWLIANRSSVDYVFLNRPEISKDYIDRLLSETRAKILYYGLDLLYLRLQREYEYTNHPHLPNLIQYTKDIEKMLLDKVHVAYYPSIEEIRLLNMEFPHVTKRAIPLYLFETSHGIQDDFKERRNLLFVGGFDHKPNSDAAIWFVRHVFPLIQKRHPLIKLYLVGSNPNEQVKALQSKRIIVTGAVSDDELFGFYQKCRLAVVPLRFGAGVKGKVLEAMHHGVPVVTTSIGAEGLFYDQDIPLIISDSPVDMGNKISFLYNDFTALKDLSLRSMRYIERHYSKENAKQILLQDIEP